MRIAEQRGINKQLEKDTGTEIDGRDTEVNDGNRALAWHNARSDRVCPFLAPPFRSQKVVRRLHDRQKTVA